MKRTVIFVAVVLFSGTVLANQYSNGYQTKDAYGNYQNSNDSYQTKDAYGNYKNSNDCFQTKDAYGNYQQSRGCSNQSK